jgi:hypothetical protein
MVGDTRMVGFVEPREFGFFVTPYLWSEKAAAKMKKDYRPSRRRKASKSTV